jgi:hypothetical protein
MQSFDFLQKLLRRDNPDLREAQFFSYPIFMIARYDAIRPAGDGQFEEVIISFIP